MIISRDPTARANALKNQEELEQKLKEFLPWYKELKKQVVRESLGLDKDGNPTLGIGDRSYSDKILDKTIDEVIKQGAELLVEGAGEVIDMALDFGHMFQDIHDRRLLGKISPKAEKWKEQKIVALVAKRMAPGVMEQAKRMHQIVPSEEGAREWLIDNYWQMEKLVNTHIKNLPTPRHSSILQG